MTLHPGVSRNHHPADVRPVRRRTPGTTSRLRWSSPRRCSRCSSGTAPTRTCTWCCSPWTPTSSAGRSPHWPGSTRRCTRGAVVVPGQPVRDPELPAIGHRDRRADQAFRVHRRHPGVLLDPGPARHVPPVGRRFPGRAGRRAPPGRGRGARQRSSTWSPTSPERYSSCDCLDRSFGMLKRRPTGKHGAGAATAKPDEENDGDRMGFRRYGEGNDTVTLEQIRQIPGVETILWSLHDKQAGAVWVRRSRSRWPESPRFRRTPPPAASPGPWTPRWSSRPFSGPRPPSGRVLVA